MALADLFSGVAARLFGAAAPPDADQAIVDETIEAIVDAVDPRIRSDRGYRKALEPGVRRTIAQLRAIAQRLPAPIALSPAAWQREPLVRCCFGRPDEVRALLGRSRELYRFFDASPGCAEAHALLAMRREARKVLAPALVDGALRQDVAQVSVSFDRHRLHAPAADAASCRREVGAGLFRRLAGLAIERSLATERRVKDLEERKGILATRLRMLQLRRDGIQRAFEDAAQDPAAEIAELEKALQATVDAFATQKASLKTLEGIVDGVRGIFEAPQKVIGLETVELRLSGTGMRVEPGSSEAATELTLQELFVGENLRGVIAFVRCAREDLPPPDDALRRAERSLI
ncbi:MAG: hypothetical protein R3357_10030 [Burkholderiales bacterium]|nr:hypothetical protein [Burkholderiales bacterium]